MVTYRGFTSSFLSTATLQAGHREKKEKSQQKVNKTLDNSAGDSLSSLMMTLQWSGREQKANSPIPWSQVHGASSMEELAFELDL